MFLILSDSVKILYRLLVLAVAESLLVLECSTRYLMVFHPSTLSTRGRTSLVAYPSRSHRSSIGHSSVHGTRQRLLLSMSSIILHLPSTHRKTMSPRAQSPIPRPCWNSRLNNSRFLSPSTRVALMKSLRPTSGVARARHVDCQTINCPNYTWPLMVGRGFALPCHRAT